MKLSNQPKKLPKNYQLVYEVVCAQSPGAHADAALIYTESKKRQAGIGYSTVYRALDRLRDVGMIQEVRVPGAASALYEVARHDHAHFLCMKCGRVDDLDYHVPDRDIADLARQHGLDIDDVVLTFNGLCKSCKTTTG